MDKEDDVTNELDIDDGTLMEAEAEDVDVEEETSDDIEDSSEMESEDESPEEEESTESEEPADETETEVSDKQPQEQKQSQNGSPSQFDWKADYQALVDEFGETAAAPFKKMFERIEHHTNFLEYVAKEKLTEREKEDRQQAYDVLGGAGIDPEKFDVIYRDAVDYLNFKKSKGETISGQDALKRASAMNGQTFKTKQTERQAKASRMERLRSIPPKGKASTTIFNADDPAEADGTAPRRK